MIDPKIVEEIKLRNPIEDVMAQYALEGYAQPLGISEYELSKLYPADFKSTLPSIEEIEQELKDK